MFSNFVLLLFHVTLKSARIQIIPLVNTNAILFKKNLYTKYIVQTIHGRNKYKIYTNLPSQAILLIESVFIEFKFGLISNCTKDFK